MLDQDGSRLENSTDYTIIVVPCYNEEKRINVSEYRKYLERQDSVHLLFVDDGSTDGTATTLRDLCSHFEGRSSVLVCDQNGGKAEAVRQGFLNALTRVPQPSIIGFWDADLATPLGSIDKLIAVMGKTSAIDMVFGSRVKLLGRCVERNPSRHYLGRIFATVVSLILKLPIYDTQCGAKLFRVSSGIQAVCSEPFLSKWVFDVEIIARYMRLYRGQTKLLEKAIYEYPLEEWRDVAGSKVRAGDFLTAFTDVLRIRLKYLA